MLRRLGPRGDGGAGIAEYAGLIVLAALILGTLWAIGVPSKVETGVSTALCHILDRPGCGKQEAGGQNGHNPGETNGQTPGADQTGGQNSDAQGNGNDPGDSGGTSLADLQKNAANAQKAANSASGKYGNIKQQIIDLLKDFIGITDVEECITKGSISSCLWAAFDIASWIFAALKIAKFAKAVKDAIKLWKVFNKGRKVIARAKNAAKRAKALLRKRELACAIPGNSFTAGTPVILANGRTRPIERIRSGDRVRAVDPATGRSLPEPVRALIRGHGVRHLVSLRVSTDPYGLRSSTLTATDNHPFWSLTRHRWVDAGRLRTNEVLAADGGRRTRVMSLSRGTRTATVYNLSVANLHTYQVRYLGTGLLVHNAAKGGCDRLVGGKKLTKGRLQHIWKRHIVRKGASPNTDKFLTTSQPKLVKMIDKTIKQGTKSTSRGDDAYVLDFGHAIGRTAQGKPISKMRVIVRKGKVVTAYPWSQ